ncbi:MAG: DNA topoisomerase I, partial [Mariniphaga sp.]|nr:DNA topoisomerase I [Mariniphaga sp.]
NTGAEKNKMFPTDIGMVVNDFLIKNFELIMDFNFTAKVEKEFDDIAIGKQVWNKMIESFYQPFHEKVESVLEKSERSKGERILGADPETGNQISVKIGRFGPIAQIGEATNDSDEKPRFASLRPGQSLETITLEDALELFRLPRELGEFENKKVNVGIGRFGPYIRHDNKFVSLTKEDDPFTVNISRAIELIALKREKDQKSIIKLFDEEPELKVLQGRWGPYISFKKKNYKISKGTVPENLELAECMEIIKNAPKAKKARKK